MFTFVFGMSVYKIKKGALRPSSAIGSPAKKTGVSTDLSIFPVPNKKEIPNMIGVPVFLYRSQLFQVFLYSHHSSPFLGWTHNHSVTS